MDQQMDQTVALGAEKGCNKIWYMGDRSVGGEKQAADNNTVRDSDVTEQCARRAQDQEPRIFEEARRDTGGRSPVIWRRRSSSNLCNVHSALN
ncbi:unnamed protein product [Cercospora beticola]|nr:unnamed protein product [Cercospora beticola]